MLLQLDFMAMLEQYLPYIIWGSVAIILLVILRIIAFIVDRDKKKKKKKKTKEDEFRGLPSPSLTFTASVLNPQAVQASSPSRPAGSGGGTVSPTGLKCPNCGWDATEADIFCGECGQRLK